ncbi:hypothetical protein VNO78_19306 [Psophocarpus tetragonolobus]|uniref:Uncharacterized protein n=1 Tax=Psophocarpus tetragonolobus TaxID=3891 RepID=A0AAN9S8L2_PSOTE
MSRIQCSASSLLLGAGDTRSSTQEVSQIAVKKMLSSFSRTLPLKISVVNLSKSNNSILACVNLVNLVYEYDSTNSW